MTIELLNMSMLTQVVDIYMNTFSREPWYDTFKSRKQVEDYFTNFFASNSFLGFVLKVDGDILGFSVGMKKPWIHGVEYYIDEFCISYDYQNAGLGSNFLRLIEKEVMAIGLNGVLLITDKSFPAYNFYQKQGFIDFKNLVVLGKEL